jgi:hypothetical protein
VSGQVNKPMVALISPAKASELLESLIVERVMECVDFRALLRVEHGLWDALGGCGLRDDQIVEIARAMIDKALDQIRHDVRRGFDACALCEDEVRRGQRPPHPAD